MKIRNTFLTAICFLFLSPAVKAISLPVKDNLITTDTKNCGIHYLTQGNTTGWHLTDVVGKCPDNFLNGSGSATIRNAFGQELITLNGYWTQGYWTGSESVPVILKNIRADDPEHQTLIFHMGQDKHTGVRFLGKMTAERQNDGSFTPFKACTPANILAITNRTDIFENELLQQELITSVLSRVETVCPKTESIYLYGSDREEPDNADIFFFAEINFLEKKIKIKRLPSSRPTSENWNGSNEVSSVYSTPKPWEIRQEHSKTIMHIQPIFPETKLPLMVDNPPENIKPAPMAESLPAREGNFQIQPRSEAESVSQTIDSSLISSQPQHIAAMTDSKLVARDTLDKVPHLLTISRLLKQPVAGKALIHIDRFDGAGTAVSNDPVTLQLKGEHLSLGWGIAEGMFSYTHNKENISEATGFVQVETFTPVSERAP